MGVNIDIKEDTVRDWVHVVLGVTVAAILKPLGRMLKTGYDSYKLNKDKEVTMKWGNVFKISVATALGFGILIAKAFL